MTPKPPRQSPPSRSLGGLYGFAARSDSRELPSLDGVHEGRERIGREDQSGAARVLRITHWDGAGDKAGGRFDAVAAIPAAVAGFAPRGRAEILMLRHGR